MIYIVVVQWCDWWYITYSMLLLLLLLYRGHLTSKRWLRSLPNRRATLSRRAGYSVMMYSIIRDNSDTLAVKYRTLT